MAAAKARSSGRVGRAFLAIRESEIAAQASGVPVALYKTLAFGVSAFYTGVAGGLFAFLVGFLSPDAFDVFLSVDFVVMIILGGLGSVPGSIAGAAVVTVLNDALAAFQNYRPLIFGAILIACMLFMPGGITGIELANACRELALERYGLMSRVVLEHWGISATADIGDIVFTLVDLGFLLSQPQDTRDEFVDVFDFDLAFEREYPWNCAPKA